MKKSIRVVALILLISLISVSLTGCNSNRKEISVLLNEFEYACNTLDVNAILDCMEPKKADAIKLALGIYGMITDKNTEEVINNISSTLSGNSKLDGNDFFSSIEIKLDDVSVEETDAIAYTTVEYKINGENYKKIAEFKCVYYIDEWYISKFDLK